MNDVVKTENNDKFATGGLLIPFEVADGITLACMKEQLEYLKDEIRLHTEEHKWMHPEDYHNSMTRLIPSLEILIAYFGG